MSFYVVTTRENGQFVREGININRMRVAADHEFPSGVLEVKKLDGAAGLARLEQSGVTLPRAARTALAERVAAQRSKAAALRRSKARQKAEEAREEARRAAAAEKQRVKEEVAAAKLRETARLKRAEKVAAQVCSEVPVEVQTVGIEAADWDSEAAPWD